LPLRHSCFCSAPTGGNCAAQRCVGTPHARLAGLSHSPRRRTLSSRRPPGKLRQPLLRSAPSPTSRWARRACVASSSSTLRQQCRHTSPPADAPPDALHPPEQDKLLPAPTPNDEAIRDGAWRYSLEVMSTLFWRQRRQRAGRPRPSVLGRSGSIALAEDWPRDRAAVPASRPMRVAIPPASIVAPSAPDCAAHTLMHGSAAWSSRRSWMFHAASLRFLFASNGARSGRPRRLRAHLESAGLSDLSLLALAPASARGFSTPFSTPPASPTRPPSRGLQ
jgi:hypothetical protein